jgi:hypothetical protein
MSLEQNICILLCHLSLLAIFCIVTFWVVVLCRLVGAYECFEAIYCLHLQAEDRGSRYLRNVGNHPPDHTVS